VYATAALAHCHNKLKLFFVKILHFKEAFTEAFKQKVFGNLFKNINYGFKLNTKFGSKKKRMCGSHPNLFEKGE